MAPPVQLRSAEPRDAGEVVEIFNHYATSGFAAYSDVPVPIGFFDRLREGALAFYVLEETGRVVGFGSMRPFLPFRAFAATALLTFFIAPGSTGRGLGSRLFDRFLEDARELGITTLVVNVASRNEQSLAFHRARGFEEAGVLRGVGVKFGQPFDLVWLQRRV